MVGLHFMSITITFLKRLFFLKEFAITMYIPIWGFKVYSLSLLDGLSLSHWYPGSGVVLDCIDF